jgi:hypothetical protein
MTFQSCMSQHMTTINSVSLFWLVNKLNEIQWRNYFSSTSLCSSHHPFRREGTNETRFLSLMEKHTESHTTFLLEQNVKLHLYSTDGRFSAHSCHLCNYGKYTYWLKRWHKYTCSHELSYYLGSYKNFLVLKLSITFGHKHAAVHV